MADETEAAACAAGSRLEGYVHAGGILNDALLGRQDPGYVRQVYAPKHSGAINLIKVGRVFPHLFGPNSTFTASRP